MVYRPSRNNRAVVDKNPSRKVANNQFPDDETLATDKDSRPSGGSGTGQAHIRVGNRPAISGAQVAVITG